MLFLTNYICKKDHSLFYISHFLVIIGMKKQLSYIVFLNYSQIDSPVVFCGMKLTVSGQIYFKQKSNQVYVMLIIVIFIYGEP